MRSVHYRIEGEFNTLTNIIYEITADGGISPIFRGQLAASSDGISRIDLSPIFQEYFETYYEDITASGLQEVPSEGIFSTVHTFTVTDVTNNTTQTFTVGYDYNTDYITELDDNRYLNDPIDNRIDPRQFLFISKSQGGTLTYTTNNTTISDSITSNKYVVWLINLATVALGDTLEASNGIEYKVEKPCRNKYVLHYVNKYGGADSLLCTGKILESFRSERTDVKLYNNTASRSDWENKRIYQSITKRYRLNTYLLTDEQADKIDHLIYSPKVFIQNLETQEITACLIEESSYNKKNFRNDRMVTYQFTVVESQEYIRK